MSTEQTTPLPTTRTDYELKNSVDPKYTSGVYVFADFARQLERELATERARAELLARTCQSSAYSAKDLIAACGAQSKRADSLEYMSNLLAIVHGDGGHYHAEHGTKKATNDAIEIVSGLKRDLEALKEFFSANPNHLASGLHSALREVAELKERQRFYEELKLVAETIVNEVRDNYLSNAGLIAGRLEHALAQLSGPK